MNARCALVLKSGSKAIVILNLLATLDREENEPDEA